MWDAIVEGLFAFVFVWNVNAAVNGGPLIPHYVIPQQNIPVWAQWKDPMEEEIKKSREKLMRQFNGIYGGENQIQRRKKNEENSN